MSATLQVLVTDANSKHSIALQRYLKQALPSVRIVGHATVPSSYCRLQGRVDEAISGDLRDVLRTFPFDMVIPVGGAAVRAVSDICSMKAVLPSKEALALCFDKSKSMRLAEQHEIPHPASWLVTDMDQEARLPDRYPCVIKPANETEAKSVFYANGRKEREKAVVDLLTSVLPEHSNGVLVQEMVIGKGRGFFAVYDRGRPISVFMHERIREYPPSGGPSTAAMAIYDPVLVDYSTRLLRTLEWHGPVMVEYKYDSGSGRYNLIEINPKFWGSLELGLSAGVNFAHVLVRIFLGEGDLLQYSDRYNRSAHFFWPLDNDLKCIIETRQFRRVGDYFRRDASTNLLQSLRVDLLKSALLLRDLLRR